MASVMPTVARQPFGEINGARLQNLTSMKNRQNAVAMSTISSPSKRKAASFEDDIDSENIDPSFFASPKRTKGAADMSKPPTTHFILKASDAAPSAPKPRTIISPRAILTPRITKAQPARATLSAPAGRSPTRAKRSGLSSRRSITRIDPPSFGAARHATASAPFSITAALSGSIPSYKPAPPAPIIRTHAVAREEKWSFEIYEDTPDDEREVLMMHGATTLDLSSDDEDVVRARLERGKENVPPVDDVSQSQARLPRSSRREAKSTTGGSLADDGAIEVDRKALGELAVEEFLPREREGPSEILVLVEEDEEDFPEEEELLQSAVEPLVFEDPVAVDVKGKGRAVEEIMEKVSGEKAALLEPIEKAEEGFALWESGSVKDDDEQ